MQTDQPRLSAREQVGVFVMVGGGLLLLDYLACYTLLTFLLFGIPIACSLSKWSDQDKRIQPMERRRLRRFSDPPRF